MSSKANPTTLGLFLVAGFGLLVGGILLFSSVRWFETRQRCILYFEGSVRGLNPGAPVKLRGVTIGNVQEILIHFNQALDDRHMPVIVEIVPDLLNRKMDEPVMLGDPAQHQRLIEGGLRGKLESESLVTGLLYVELDTIPGAPEPVFHQLKPLYPEIPTVPTRIEALMNNLAQVDLKGITERLATILDRLDSMLGTLHVAEISRNLTNLLGSLESVIANPNLTNSLASLHDTLNQMRRLATTLEARIDPLAVQADATLRDASTAIRELRGAAQDVRDLIAPEAPTRRELNDALEQLSQAGRSIAALADYLNRNPNALLTGRPRPETPP